MLPWQLTEMSLSWNTEITKKEIKINESYIK